MHRTIISQTSTYQKSGLRDIPYYSYPEHPPTIETNAYVVSNLIQTFRISLVINVTWDDKLNECSECIIRTPTMRN